jgi:hypothetical protein
LPPDATGSSRFTPQSRVGEDADRLATASAFFRAWRAVLSGEPSVPQEKTKMSSMRLAPTASLAPFRGD